eukprot:g840.t1
MTLSGLRGATEVITDSVGGEVRDKMVHNRSIELDHKAVLSDRTAGPQARCGAMTNSMGREAAGSDPGGAAKHGKDPVKAMGGYSVTNIKISADKQKTATMAKDVIQVMAASYRNLIGARKPTDAVYKKTTQPTATTKDLEEAVAELQHMEQMERAAAEISNSKIEAAVADAAVQLAIQQAAEQLAKSTYEEQRGPLMAAMESRVQQAAHNAKRAATEAGGNEPNAKRGPAAT